MIKHFTGRLVAAAAVCCSLAACEGGDSDSTTIDSAILADDSVINDSDDGSINDDVALASPATGFDGTWESNCAQELPFAGSEFQQATLVAEGNTSTSTIRSFLDSDCSVPSNPAVAISEFSSQFPGGSVTTPLGEASFIDDRLVGFVIDGFDAFELGQQTGVDPVQYNIFLVGTDGRLYFGEPGFTLEDRPTELKTDVFFTRQ